MFLSLTSYISSFKETFPVSWVGVGSGGFKLDSQTKNKEPDLYHKDEGLSFYLQKT